MSNREIIQEVVDVILENDVATGYCHNEDYLKVIVYLSDWKSCLEFQKPITPIRWKHGEIGPEADIDLSNFIRPERLSIKQKISDLWNNFFKLSKAKTQRLKINEEKIVEELMVKLSEMPLSEVYRLANSTFPMITTSTDDKLKLREFSNRYKHSHLKATLSFVEHG